MKKLIVYLILTTITVICFTGKPSQSQVTVAPKTKFRVLVRIRCNNQITKNTIQNNLNEELRNLQDVITTQLNEQTPIEEYPTHGLHLIVTSGNETIAIASAYTKLVYPYELLIPYLSKEKMMEIYNDDVFEIFYANHIYSNVVLGHTKNLHRACKDIVTEFDTKLLKTERNKK